MSHQLEQIQHRELTRFLQIGMGRRYPNRSIDVTLRLGHSLSATVAVGAPPWPGDCARTVELTHAQIEEMLLARLREINFTRFIRDIQITAPSGWVHLNVTT